MLRLFLVVAPVYVWLLAITALPHKEERFLYVTYPLVRPANLLVRQGCALLPLTSLPQHYCLHKQLAGRS